MTSRSPAIAQVLAALLTATIMLAGCGSAEHSVADPSPIRTPSPTATPSDEPSEQASEEPSAPSRPTDKPARRNVQVIRVTKYGASFELPKGWVTLDAKNVLKRSTSELDKLAKRMGMSSSQLLKMLTSSVQTFSVSDQGADNGFLDNVNSIGVAQPDVSDDELRLGMATVGAKVLDITHPPNEFGDVAVLRYRLVSGGRTIQGVGVSFDAGDNQVEVTVSSVSRERADRIGAQIAASLKTTGTAGTAGTEGA